MKSARLSLMALALTAATVGTAFAADASAPRTRDQVRAELAEARRNGTLIADGQTGATYRDLNPGRYATKPEMMSGKTRAQVQAELQQAWANGDLVADGQTGATLRELNPGRYPMQAAADRNAPVRVGSAASFTLVR